MKIRMKMMRMKIYCRSEPHDDDDMVDDDDDYSAINIFSSLLTYFFPSIFHVPVPSFPF